MRQGVRGSPMYLLPNSVRNWGIVTKALASSVAVLALGAVVLVVYLRHASRQSTLEQGIASAHNTIEQYRTLRGYYSSHVADKVYKAAGLEVGSAHKGKDRVIPLPATLIHDLSEEFARLEGSPRLRLYS